MKFTADIKFTVEIEADNKEECLDYLKDIQAIQSSDKRVLSSTPDEIVFEEI